MLKTKELIEMKNLEDAIQRWVGEKEFDWFLDHAYDLPPAKYLDALRIIYGLIIVNKKTKPSLALQVVTANIIQAKHNGLKWRIRK